jgi:pimeloyl-ACP methyl ester carboxylesterase
MGTVTSRDGTVIGFATVGQGPPMVLVHGGTADHRRWEPVLPALSAEYTVHAVDRRGRGMSGDGPGYDVRREGEDIAAVAEAAGGDVFVVGHSYGALCALEAALRTDAIGRMVLYEPPAATPGHHVSPPEVLAALRSAKDSEEILAIFYREALHLTDEQLAAMRRTPVWKARLAAAPTIVRELEEIEAFDISARLAGIRVPVRLLLGTRSPAYFAPATAAIADRLPDAEVVPLPGQAHMAINEATHVFLENVLSFGR